MVGKVFVLVSVLGTSVALGAAPKDIQAFTSANPMPLVSGRGNLPSASLALARGPASGSYTYSAESFGGQHGRGRDGSWSRDDRDRDDWRERRGWGRDRDRDRVDVDFNFGWRPPARPIVIEQPVAACPPPAPVVIHGPRDVRPHEVSFTAVQAGDVIIITAIGQNTTGGFTTSLSFAGYDEGKPVAQMFNYAPRRSDFVAQCFTPFKVSGFVKSCEPVCSVKIRIGRDLVCVPVEQIGSL